VLKIRGGLHFQVEIKHGRINKT